MYVVYKILSLAKYMDMNQCKYVHMNSHCVAAALNLSVDEVAEDEEIYDEKVIIIPVTSITIIFYKFYF